MANKLQLGDLTIPLDAVTETFAFLAKRGAGKSYCASVIAEQLLDEHCHTVILDPMGIWFGLRTAADGKGKGYQIPILGGEHGDIPLEPGLGAYVADLVVVDKLSMVIDVSLFSKKARKQFVSDFAERLYRKNREPLHLILEEADMFAPQKPRQGEERMLGAIEDIVRRGRSRGIGVSLITQRSAVLNKDVLTQTECLVAMRTTSPHDKKAIGDWIDKQADRDAKNEVMDSLAGLPTGTAWFWSPGWLGVLQKVEVQKKRTLDTGATPKVGGKRKAMKTVADVDLDKLRVKMINTIAKAEAENPRHLRELIKKRDKRIDQLETQAKTRPRPVDETETQASIDAALAEAHAIWRETYDRQRATISELVAKWETLAARLGEFAYELQGFVADMTENAPGNPECPRIEPPKTRKRSTATVPAGTAPVVAERPLQGDGSAGAPEVGGSEQRILDAIAWLNAIGVVEPEQAAVCSLAGFKSPGSGGYKNPRSRLRTKGLVEYRGKQIVMTDTGRVIAQSPTIDPTIDDLHSEIFRKLGGAESKLLKLLLAAWPKSVENEKLASGAGYDPTSGGFKNPRSRLRTMGLVDYPTQGETRASDFLFPGM